MSTSTLPSKGQATIPKDIRKRLNLHPGDRLEFVIDEDGRVLVLPASVDASELPGMLKRPGALWIGLGTGKRLQVSQRHYRGRVREAVANQPAQG